MGYILCLYLYFLWRLIFFAHGYMIIFKQIYLTHKWDLNRTTILSQSGPESNGNEEVLHTPQISRTGASQSDVVSVISGHSFLEYS